MVAVKRTIVDTEYRNTTKYIWFVWDVPPQEHPNFNKHQKRKNAQNKEEHPRKNPDKNFDEEAPIFLERFTTAMTERMKAGNAQSDFKLQELATLLGTSKKRLYRWRDVGVEGYGRLPKIVFDRTKVGMYDSNEGRYTTLCGKVQDYFRQEDVVRWLKKMNPATNKFRTVSDATTETNADDIAEKEGWFVYDASKCAPLTYEGFVRWATQNVFFYDRKTRRKVAFNPNMKQKALYKAAFQVHTETGLFQHKTIGCCRPRGDYKTFDMAILALFRFFNMPDERIYLVTNSVQQTSHLVYKEMVGIIKTSPTLSLMTNTYVDIQMAGIYLMAGKGKENVFNSIDIISAEGGARSNATCFVWSEAWRYKGDNNDVAEISQSIRGVDNAWFLVESTVAPKGHFFHGLYEDYLSGETSTLFFQYYDGTERQNPKIDSAYLKDQQRRFPLQHKMFFDNKWEDASQSLFPPARLIEMGHIGIDGGTGRNEEMVHVINEIVDLDREIRKLGGVTDITHLRAHRDFLMQRLVPVDRFYQVPAEANIIDRLIEFYNSDFIIGMGLDRAKSIDKRADRTVLTTVARGILDPKIWGTDRIFFILDVHVFDGSSTFEIIRKIFDNANMYAGGIAYVDLEDYNVIDLKDTLEKEGLEGFVEIAKTGLKHQREIFGELHLSSEGGYLKCPQLNCWFDDDNKVHHNEPPVGIEDILRTEMAVFEHQEGRGSDTGDRASREYFGAPTKKIIKRTKLGEAKDDTVFSLAHAVWASIRGDVPASTGGGQFATASINKDVMGDYKG